MAGARRHGGALLRLRRSRRGEPEAQLGFTDGGDLLVAPSSMATRVASPQAEACRAALQEAQVAAARQVAEERAPGSRERDVLDAGTPTPDGTRESPWSVADPSWSDIEPP